ncbi:CamS family sex pheromone protein [Virgibacillus necropolis]|uniref:CamS family sex pheromone protein n=1 Tax=Virgibacillus necropolis TaxID=163877 RepID=UPI00384B436F
MKKIAIWFMGALLFMTSCSPNMNEDEVVKKEDEKADQETSIVPSYQVSKENYKMVLPYEPSAARGLIVSQMGNRLDIDEMEEGLRRHSKEYFDPSKYYFQAGQNLSKDLLLKWLEEDLTDKQIEEIVNERVEERKDLDKPVNEEIIKNIKENVIEEETKGLNPKLKNNPTEKDYRNNPRYLSHILEQNFLKKNKDNSVELAGISIGLALKSEYRFQTETGGPYYYEKISKEVMLKQGKQMAQTILERIRKIEGLGNIPIMFALYREESQGSPVPGNFVVKTGVQGGDMSIGEWDSIKEDYILFPSDEATEKYYDDSQLVSDFTNEVAQFFPNYVGVIGEGFYIDGELKKLTLEVPIEFYGKGEVIGFTQYAYGLVKEMFPDYFDLEINVTSIKNMESTIYRDAGAKNPTVHIFN